MTSAPKSHRALVLAAFHCQCRDIDAYDGLLLSYLAQNADFGNDPKCHPGNRNISDAVKLKDRATDNHIAKCIKLGLIERVSRADGRKHASVYRICWSSSFYPDRTPNGERLINRPDDSGENNRAPIACADNVGEKKEPRSLPCADSGANRAPTDPQSRTENNETAHENAETAHPMVPAAFDLPRTCQEHTHTQTQNASASVSKNTFDQVSKYLHTEMLTSQWKKGEKDQVDRLIREYGWEKFYAAQLLYWREQDPEQFGRTIFRWTGLINSFAGLVHKVTPQYLEELSRERFKKEHPEEYERQMNEMVSRQIAEHQNDFASREEQGDSPEEFLAYSEPLTPQKMTFVDREIMRLAAEEQARRDARKALTPSPATEEEGLVNFDDFFGMGSTK